jgi:cytidylate kinase
MIITIDGPAASGKSAAGRRVAERLGFLYFDTGLTYRAAGWAVYQGGVDPSDTERVIRFVQELPFEIRPLDGMARVFINGRDVTDNLTDDNAAKVGSKIAALPRIRSILVPHQRRIASQNTVVVGRDAGTVIFPEAELKIFLTADPAVRAQRRQTEIQERGIDISYEQVRQDIRERDQRDIARPHSPLVPAPDALIIDTTHTTLDDLVERIVEKAFNTRISSMS